MSRQSVESHRTTSTPSPSHATSDIEIGNNKGNTTGASSARGTKVASKTILSKTTRSIFLGLGACILFTFASYYAYQALVAPNPALGALSFTPSATVLVINLLSQITHFTLSRLLSASLTHFRWSLLCHENGVRMLTSLALDSGTTLYGVALLLRTRGTHRIWCLLRYDGCTKETDSQTDVPLTLRCPWIYSHRFSFPEVLIDRNSWY